MRIFSVFLSVLNAAPRELVVIFRGSWFINREKYLHRKVFRCSQKKLVQSPRFAEKNLDSELNVLSKVRKVSLKTCECSRSSTCYAKKTSIKSKLHSHLAKIRTETCERSSPPRLKSIDFCPKARLVNKLIIVCLHFFHASVFVLLKRDNTTSH